MAVTMFVIKMIVMMALSYAYAAATAKKPPKPNHAKPASLEQFNTPTAEEGRPIQVLFGKRYVEGPNVVHFGNLRTSAIVRRV